MFGVFDVNEQLSVSCYTAEWDSRMQLPGDYL